MKFSRKNLFRQNQNIVKLHDFNLSLKNLLEDEWRSLSDRRGKWYFWK